MGRSLYIDNIAKQSTLTKQKEALEDLKITCFMDE